MNPPKKVLVLVSSEAYIPEAQLLDGPCLSGNGCEKNDFSTQQGATLERDPEVLRSWGQSHQTGAEGFVTDINNGNRTNSLASQINYTKLYFRGRTRRDVIRRVRLIGRDAEDKSRT